jgi:thioredoxin-like negative regulator of GroEL
MWADSGNVTRVSQEDVSPEEASPQSKDAPDGASLDIDLEALRVPPVEPDREFRPIRLCRLSARVDHPGLVRLDSIASPGGLVVGETLRDAELLLARGDVAGVQKLVGGDDLSPGARALLARAALMEGELEAAKEILAGIVDDDDAATAAAVVALTEGDLDLAHRRATFALGRAPNGVVENYTMALVKVGSGDIDEARELLARVAASVPEHAVARHQLGQLILASGDPARAGTLFEMALVIAPDFVPPALSLAEMFIEGRQLGEAMNLLTSITERRPGLLSPRLMQLRVLLAVGELDGAKSLVDALHAAAPDVPEISLSWAEVRARRGEVDAAVTHLEKLRAHTDPSVKERALRLLAQLDLAMEPPRRDDAAEKLEEACRAMPHGAELRLETAQLQFGRGDLVAARAHLEGLLAIPNIDLSILLSGAVLAANHAQFKAARMLGNAARARVVGTSAERQIEAFLEQLPDV